MSVIQPVRSKMKELIPNLPSDWAKQVGEKMGIRPEVVRSHVLGIRGKRNKEKVLQIYRYMKELHGELVAEIAELIEE